MRFVATLAALLLAAGTGCADDIDRDSEPLVTIAQGVYGQTSEQDDVCYTHCGPEYFPMTLQVMPADASSPVLEVGSSKRGFYQLALEAGEHRICTTFGRCTTFSVGAGLRVRRDYEFSVGPGWSSPGAP